MKKESSGAGAMFMKRRALEPKLFHFYDGSAALIISETKHERSCNTKSYKVENIITFEKELMVPAYLVGEIYTP